MPTRFVVTMLWAAALFGALPAGHATGLATAVDRETGAVGSPVPSPALSPRDVVRIQLESLRANGADDGGIAVCFRFASPANRRITGPLDRFAGMIRKGPYRLMLNYLDASFDEVERYGDTALQRVTLLGKRYAVTYVFALSVQRGGPCEGCWMTDSVQIESVRERVVT